jgi:hypothetical protein
MAAKYDITIDQGSEYVLNMTLTQYGEGLSLAGYTVRGQIRPTITSNTLTASFTGEALNDAEGSFRISLTAAQTAVIPPGVYFYDIEIYLTTSITRLMEGKVLVRPEVTR